MSKPPAAITVLIGLTMFAALAAGSSLAAADETLLELPTRRQIETAPKSGTFQTAHGKVTWSPSKTAIVICDMWDEHWCRGATRRVAEMAPRMNEVVRAAREKGVLIVHCPSSCLDFYKDTPMKPFVPHTQGTDLVVDHIEKYWCPTVTSSVLTGKEEFVFVEKNQPHVVFMIGEREYRTNESLPAFARKYLAPRGVRYTIVHADEKDKNCFPGLAALKTADLLVLSVRRRSLPEDQLQLVRQFMAAGKPLVGIRTASHAFHTNGKHPEGHAEWQSFDAEVLGGNYHGHHANGVKSQLSLAENAGDHAILDGVSVSPFQGHGSLYQVSPLAKTTTPLVIGKIAGKSAEPVAWTHKFGKSRVFYTSLGHIDDFESEDFNRLLVNAVFWGLNRQVPATTTAQ